METINGVEKSKQVANKPLSAKNRCDQCQAQAYYHAQKDGLGLMFCIHHFKKSEDSLFSQGFGVSDHSWALGE